MVRIAVIDRFLCKPKRCNFECLSFCPLVRTGTKAVIVDKEKNRPIIVENLCTGCGICTKKCPFKAIKIINLPEEYGKDIVHMYGPNAFRLYRLPIPKKGKVVGIIGRNGTGKSTALKILAGKIKPNLGSYDNPPEDSQIIRYFRGSELQPYFEELFKGKLKAVLKPQEVDIIPKFIKGKVCDLLERIDEVDRLKRYYVTLNLEKIWNRKISELSGGELQKIAVTAALIRNADIYLIDEPSSYLDVKERLNIAKAIREAVSEDIYLVVVEHDLAILDYISDLVHIIYGEPGAYGIVSLPRGVRTGINAYLQGFLKEENLRIRREAITFDLRKEALRFPSKEVFLSWSKLRVSLGTFKLEVLPGEVHRGEVIGILGPNGIGKTTFVRVLAGEIIPEEGYVEKRGSIDISYKPQFISYLRENDITVLSYLREVSDYDISSSHIRSAIIKPLDIERLYKRKMSELSGGELQRIAIASTMLKKAEIYLFDEPMAYLDVEQRFTVAKMIRRICDERESAAFVVEHDLIMQSFIANSIIVFGGEPSENGLANAPMSLRKGMNIFLRDVGITIRRDKETKRPRINREGSWMDRYQKSHGIYYL